MAERIDCAVIGAGVVGLAVARALAQAGREVLILEAADAIGTGTSSRNSEVIHAGLYYPTGSLKARLCVAGNRLLRGYCGERGVDFRMVAKLIVATDAAEEAKLEVLARTGAANGVPLEDLSGADACVLEPELRCTRALLSPTTGILDSHGLMLALLADAEAAGATLVLRTPVAGGALAEDGIRLRTGGGDPIDMVCRTVVNCAGLDAQLVAAAIGVPAEAIPPRHLCKGNYFTLTGRSPFTRLIYPIPTAASLGCHYTLDWDGRGRFGPDVEWVDSLDYRVDPRRAEVFYAEIRRYWPGLPDGALQPAYAGIRPKIQAPGQPAHDFVVQGPSASGIPGYVGLYGIESPGLTSCLAIAELVREMLA